MTVMSAARLAAHTMVIGGLIALSSCGVSQSGSPVSSASSLDHQMLGIPVSVDFRPEVHGFSFSNFGPERYSQRFDAHALVAVAGTGPRICVDGVEDQELDEDWDLEGSDAPCEVTEEAAEFIEMVEAYRVGGHCEGMVVLAALRYSWGSEPVTSEVPDDERTINAIIRAFATIFLPEVQAEARSWISTSLADTVETLALALSEGTLDYGMGIYRPDGGHEVLPYAIEYPRENLARIMVYDTNWPGVERFVEIDLKNDTWRFSFAGDDQATDPHAWEGGHEDLDLNSVSVRIAALEARGVVVAPPAN
jgi:hypothetical protein